MALDLTKPRQDSTNWGIDMNTNLEAIEDLVNANESEIVDALEDIANNTEDIGILAGLVEDNADDISDNTTDIIINAGNIGYHDRGDPADLDWDEGDLTADNDWHDLDLSGIVPDKATLVGIFTEVRDNLVNQIFRVRTKGNVNTRNRDQLITVLANVYNSGMLFVAPDADRIIQYRANNTTWTNIQLCITGWFLGG